MPHGEALDVDLVDDRIREVAPQRSVGSPVEGRVRDQAERHVPGGVERAGRVVVVPGVVEHRGAERHLAAHRPRVRVEQQLGRVAAQPPGRVVRPVHAEPVGLPRAGPGDDPVPGAAVVVRQPVPGLGPGVVEQAYLGRLGHAGGHREVGPAVERRRAQGARPAGKCIRHSAYVTHRRYPKAPGDEARHEPCGASRADGLYPGLVPFQVWLPRGYAAAPGPARAIMAGVCVNVAFYGMWRTLALLGRAPGWLVGAVLVLGAVTALLGIAHAAVQNRLSRVIAYSVIAAGLSPVVPGGLVMGALKSPWVLQPVFAGFSILSPSWLWLEMPVMLLLVVLFSWAVSGRRLLRVRRVPPWRSATIGVDGLDSYTAFGYANPTRRVLAGVLHSRAEVREVMLEDSDRDEGVGPPDRGDVAEQEQAAHLKYASDVMEVVEAYLYRPALRGFLAVVAVAKRLQSGRLDAYLLCMLIALIAVIAVVTALA